MIMPAAARSLNASRPATQPTPTSATASSAQPFKLSKISQMMVGMLALQRGANAQVDSLRSAPSKSHRALQEAFSLTANLTGKRNVTNTTRSALSAPFEFSVSPDFTRLQLYNLQGEWVVDRRFTYGKLNQPYRIVAHRVPGGGILTTVVEQDLQCAWLFDVSAGKHENVANLCISTFPTRVIEMNTLGASLGGTVFNRKNDPEYTSYLVRFSTCKFVAAGNDELEIFQQEFDIGGFGYSTNQVLHSISLPSSFRAEYCSTGYYNDKGNYAVIFRHEDGTVHLRTFGVFFYGLNPQKPQDFELPLSTSSPRLSFLSFSVEDNFLAAVSSNEFSLFAYDVESHSLQKYPAPMFPLGTSLDVDVPLVTSNNRILAVGISDDQPVLMIFPRDGQGFSSGQQLNLPFLDANASNKIIGLDAEGDQVLLLVKSTKNDGTIEHQNWRVDISISHNPNISLSHNPNWGKIAGLAAAGVAGVAGLLAVGMMIRRHYQQSDNNDAMYELLPQPYIELVELPQQQSDNNDATHESAAFSRPPVDFITVTLPVSADEPSLWSAESTVNKVPLQFIDPMPAPGKKKPHQSNGAIPMAESMRPAPSAPVKILA